MRILFYIFYFIFYQNMPVKMIKKLFFSLILDGPNEFYFISRPHRHVAPRMAYAKKYDIAGVPNWGGRVLVGRVGFWWRRRSDLFRWPTTAAAGGGRRRWSAATAEFSRRSGKSSSTLSSSPGRPRLWGSRYLVVSSISLEFGGPWCCLWFFLLAVADRIAVARSAWFGEGENVTIDALKCLILLLLLH